MYTCSLGPLCGHGSITMEQSESPSTIKEHTLPLAYINTYVHFPLMPLGLARVRSCSCGIQLSQMFTVKPLTMRWVCLGDLSDFARQCRPSEAPVLSRPVETDPRGVQRMCADPKQAWMPSCPFPGDQGHISRDLQRTVLEHNESAPHASPNQMVLIVGKLTVSVCLLLQGESS